MCFDYTYLYLCIINAIIMGIGVIIARFQTPYLHDGHKELINNVKLGHDKLVVVLGVSPITGSRRSPYDYFTREKMIKKDFPEVVVLPLSDHPSDEVWSKNLDNLLSSSFPNESFGLYGSRDSFISYYSGRYKTIELPEHGDYNATELRAMFSNKVSDSRDFRAGILYAYHNQYLKVYPTVDIAVFKNNKSEMLLGKKANSDKWRLVGGFTDPTDNSYEEAAKREMKEECGDIEVGEMQYETSRKIDDWRYRNESDKIITLLFSCDYIYGQPKAQDDIVDLAWFKTQELSTLIANGEINNEHIPLLECLINKYTKS